jgi:hypothetical protein
MSTADFARKVFSMVERDLQSRPPTIEFEMAYQARVAADRIRFVVRQIDEPARHCDQLREASMQLLDALDRLEAAERRFQDCWRNPVPHRQPDLDAIGRTNRTARACSTKREAHL